MSDPRSDQPLVEIGATGLKRSGGFVDQEWLRQLSSPRKRYDAFSEMRDNDATVGGVLYAIEALIRQVEWSVVPSQDTEEARAAALFLEECIIDLATGWEAFITEALTMLPYGYALFEVVYKLRGGPTQEDARYRSRYADGKIGWRKFAPRAQDTVQEWEFSEEGDAIAFVQSAAPAYQPTRIPLDRCLLFRTKAELDNPEGRSLLRNAYRSWFFLKRIQEFEAIGVERDLAGLPIMQCPPEIMSPSASADQKRMRSALEAMVQQIRRDQREGLVLPAEIGSDGQPTGYKFTLATSGGRRQMDTDAIIKRYESRIAMTVMAEFIMLGMDKTGSFALADSKTDLFAVSLRSILQSMSEVINKQAVQPLFSMNPCFPEETWPKITFGDIEKPDMERLGSFLTAMGNAGLLTPDAGLEDKLRELANLPPLAASPSL